jgi:hypothetical protein
VHCVTASRGGGAQGAGHASAPEAPLAAGGAGGTGGGRCGQPALRRAWGPARAARVGAPRHAALTLAMAFQASPSTRRTMLFI